MNDIRRYSEAVANAYRRLLKIKIDLSKDKNVKSTNIRVSPYIAEPSSGIALPKYPTALLMAVDATLKTGNDFTFSLAIYIGAEDFRIEGEVSEESDRWMGPSTVGETVEIDVTSIDELVLGIMSVADGLAERIDVVKSPR